MHFFPHTSVAATHKRVITCNCMLPACVRCAAQRSFKRAHRVCIRTHTHPLHLSQLAPLLLSVPGVSQSWWTLCCPMRLVDSLRKAPYWLNVSLPCLQCQLKVRTLTLSSFSRRSQVAKLFHEYEPVIIFLPLLTQPLILFIKTTSRLLTFTFRVSLFFLSVFLSSGPT